MSRSAYRRRVDEPQLVGCRLPDRVIGTVDNQSGDRGMGVVLDLERGARVGEGRNILRSSSAQHDSCRPGSPWVAQE